MEAEWRVQGNGDSLALRINNHVVSYPEYVGEVEKPFYALIMVLDYRGTDRVLAGD